VAALDYLTQTSQLEKANQLVQDMLSDPAWANRAELWRLGWRLAFQRKQMPRAYECLAQALELEYRSGAGEENGTALRTDYQNLLNHYAQAASVQTGSAKPQLVKQVVRAVDRWRALDPGAEACETAWPILCHLGDCDLAWDYLLTARTVEGSPSTAFWTGLANLLQQAAELNLAERAFAQACQAEPANGDLLWRRANNLLQAGEPVAARRLLRQLADGTWAPQYQTVQAEARRLVGER
jgi:tetratricopeptide (TPR) repeat protein